MLSPYKPAGVSIRYDPFPSETQPVKGMEEEVALGLKFHVLIRLDKLLQSGGRQVASWVPELTAKFLAELLHLGSYSHQVPPSVDDGAPPILQLRPPPLRVAPRPSLKKKGGPPTRSTRNSSGHHPRADFALVCKLEPSVAGLAATSAGGASAGGQSQASTPATDVRRIALVSELKRLGKLVDADGNPLDLHRLSREGNASVCRMLDQLFTYMVLTRVEFGWLSCFYFTWLAWRPLSDPDCLHLSKPFRHDTSAVSGGVTTMAALSWMQDLAMERTIRQGIRHSPYATPKESDDMGADETNNEDEDAGADSEDEEWFESGGDERDSGEGDGDGKSKDSRHVAGTSSLGGGSRGSKRYSGTC